MAREKERSTVRRRVNGRHRRLGPSTKMQLVFLKAVLTNPKTAARTNQRRGLIHACRSHGQIIHAFRFKPAKRHLDTALINLPNTRGAALGLPRAKGSFTPADRWLHAFYRAASDKSRRSVDCASFFSFNGCPPSPFPTSPSASS